ncbi:MAG: response regulator [Chromatiales bacterium]|nr:response regulator [Chromatiales bacterium]
MTSDAGLAETSRRAWLYAEQSRLLYENLPASLLASALLSVGLVFVQWGYIGTPVLLGWLSAMWILIGWRAWGARLYHAQATEIEDHAPWLGRFRLGAVAAGVIWGSAGVLLFPDDLAQQVFLAFVIAGVAAGAVTSMSASWSAVGLFLPITLVPVTLTLLAEGSTITMVMGAMSALFTFIVLTNAHRYFRNTEENIVLHHEAAVREQELRMAEERNRLLLNATADGIFGLDRETRVDFANPTVETMLGLPAESLIGRCIHEVTGHCDARGCDKPLEQCEISRAVREGIAQSGGDTYFRRSDGSVFPVRFDSRSLTLDERLIGAVVTVRDISEQKRNEATLIAARQAAEVASESKSRFLATVSHEIRTPLHGILGMADVLLDSSLEEDQREQVDVIKESGRALLGIIDDILDFSRAEAGRLKLYPERFDLLATVEAVARLCSARVMHKDLQVLARFRRHVPRYCVCDQKRFRQILVNLVGNAVKFTESGYVLTEVDALSGDEQGVRITIADTGIGMSEEALPRLFSPFLQVDSSDTRNFGGTGLGLAITKQLLELMGGRIEVRSEPGRGSEFILYLPLACEPVGDAGRNLPLAGRSVALFDSLPVAQTVIGEGLVELGADLLADPDAALNDGDPVDIVVVDGDMAKRRLEQLQHLPPQVVLLVTGHGRQTMPTPLAERPSSVFLRKPVSQDQWLKALGQQTGKTNGTTESVLRLNDRNHDLRLLVAEDNHVNQRVLASVLDRLGIAFDIANDGRAALDNWRASKYDLILMDCQMPVMDGIEATRSIRAEESDQRIPIIALTANAFGQDRKRCLEAGMDDFVSKPFSAETLIAVLQRWLSDQGSAAADEALSPQLLEISSPVIDNQTFRELREILEEEFDELVDTFVTETDGLIGEVEKGLAGDMDELRRAAHSIKSASANLGATTLSDLAKSVELAAADGSLSARGELIAPLRSEFQRVCAWIDENR